jgi:hypothetical protein
MQEAEKSMNHLVDLVDKLVASNADLRIRIDALTMDPVSLASASIPIATIQEDEMSQSKSSRTFEVDLQTSRVYQRVRPRDSIWTLTSSQRGSMALSIFSALTLGDLSAVSVCNLPVWSTDLSNAEHYRFGQNSSTISTAETKEQQLGRIRKPLPSQPDKRDPPFSQERIRIHTENRQLLLRGKRSWVSRAEKFVNKKKEEEEAWLAFVEKLR